MAQNYGATPNTTDEFGSPIRRDSNQAAKGGEYGTGAGYGTHEKSTGGIGSTGGGTDEFGNPVRHGVTDTGYGSAGHGGSTDPSVVEHRGVPASNTRGENQEKTGILGQIKEKLPGAAGNKEDQYGGTGGTQEHQEKKGGFMGQVKEKLPGGAPAAGNKEDHYGGTGCTQEHQEKKGIVDQAKEKLPGGVTARQKDGHYSHDDTSAATKPFGGTACTDDHNQENKGGAARPGSKDDHYSAATKPYGGTAHTGDQNQEKKGGVAGKIKEKLPGGGQKDDLDTPYGGTKYTQDPPEKKGMMEKIKEKLPGQH